MTEQQCMASLIIHQARRAYLSCLMRLWQWRAHYLRVWGAVANARRASIQQWRTAVIRRLSRARETHCAREVWHCARLSAAVGMRRKKRWIHVVNDAAPALKQWDEHLQRPGPEGGQQMHCLWNGFSTFLALGVATWSTALLSGYCGSFACGKHF